MSEEATPASDVDELLSDQDTSEEPTEVADETEETSEESETDESSGEELEEEVETPDEDESEGETGRISFSKLKASFGKDVFKKMPELRHVLGREQAYTELFPTLDHAREATEAVGALNHFNELVVNGVVAPIFESLQKNAPEGSYQKFVSNFLPSLKKTDRDAYFAVAEPVVVEFLSAAMNQMVNTNNEIGITSLKNVARMIFGKPELPETRLPEAKLGLDKPDERISQKEQELLASRFADFADDTVEAATRKVRSILRHEVDPEGKLQGSYRDFVLDQIMSESTKVLKSDPQYQAKFSRLLRMAQAGDMSYKVRDALVQHFVRRMKEVSVPIRRKVLAQGTQAKSEKAPVYKNPSAKANPEGKQKLGQPKLGGTTKDDVDFLLSQR